MFRNSGPTGGGFTLIEAVIVIGVMAILAALILPLAVNQLSAKRYDACREELKLIKQAIVGDPSLTAGGVRSSFGFVGDLGRLPAPTGAGSNRLGELTANATGMPAWQLLNGVRFGWRGPYVSELLDPWGNEYYYSRAAAGTLTVAAVWSSGADGQSGTTDDLAISVRNDEAFSYVCGGTYDACSVGSAFTNIVVWYPNGTTVASTAAVSSTAPNPYFTVAVWIPIGLRQIAFTTATPTAVSRQLPVLNGPLTAVNLQDPGVCN